MTNHLDYVILQTHVIQESVTLQLSTQLLQEGRPEELDRLMMEKDEEHRRHLEALEAELDAEEAEHSKHITQSIDEDHVNQIKEGHKDILNKVCQNNVVFKDTCIHMMTDLIDLKRKVKTKGCPDLVQLSRSCSSINRSRIL